MRLPPGHAFDDEGQRVPTTPPQDKFFDDAPEAQNDSGADHAEMLLRICDVLEDGQPRSMAARLEAVKFRFGLSDLSIREAAQKSRCGPVTMLEARRKIERFFRGES